MQLSYEKRQFIARLLTLALIASLLVSLFGVNTAVAADASRTAIIEEVVGEAFIKKAGGKREFLAYEGMGLNKGDHIRTAHSSQLKLSLADHDDYITILENTEVYLSQLTDQNEQKKTGITKWFGSVFAKVKSMLETQDEFSIETPTAIMGVRGTHFTVGTDPVTGDTWIRVFSGVVGAARNDDERQDSNIYPGHDGVIWGNIGDDSDLDPNTFLSDFGAFTQFMEEELIRQILESLEGIRQENDSQVQDIIDRLSLQDEDFRMEDMQSQYENFLHNIVAIIAQKAVNQGSMTNEQLNQIIRDAYGSQMPDLDRNPVVGDRIDDSMRRQQEAMQERMDERQRALEEQRKEREERSAQNQALLEQIKEQQRLAEERNREAQEQKKLEAEERYRETLAQAERERFEQEQLAREQDQRRALAEQQRREVRPAPTPGPSIPTPPPSDGGTTGPKVSLQTDVEPDGDGFINLSEGQPLTVKVVLSGVDSITGFQLHLLYHPVMYVEDGHVSYNTELFGEDAIDYLKFTEEEVLVDNEITTELLYALLTGENLNPVTIENGVYIFEVTLNASDVINGMSIRLAKIIVLDEDGNEIDLNMDDTVIKVRNLIDPD